MVVSLLFVLSLSFLALSSPGPFSPVPFSLVFLRKGTENEKKKPLTSISSLALRPLASLSIASTRSASLLLPLA